MKQTPPLWRPPAAETTGSRWAMIPVTASCVIAGFGFHRLFAWHDLIPVVLVAAVLPAVLALALCQTNKAAADRKPPALWLGAAATVVLWILTISCTLFRDRAAAHVLPSANVLHAAVLGLHDGWKTMLTTVPPLPGQAGTLVTVSAATWLASYACAEATLRTRKASVILLPALALLALAAVLDAGSPGSDGPTAAAFAVTGGFTILLRNAHSFTGRRTIAALTAAPAIAAVSTLTAPQLPPIADAQPFSLRSQVTPPPPAVRTAISPLDEIPAWLQNPDTELFTVRAARAQNWRLAVFDTFDGITWTCSDRFVPTGGRIPADPAAPTASAAADRQTQQMTIAALTGPWLPAADRPTRVSGTTVLVDPAGGELLGTAPLHPGLGYTVESAAPRPDATQLRSASAAADPEAAAALVLPTTDASGQDLDAYQDLKQIAQQATAGAASPFQQAAMLERYLQQNESVDVTAVPGHTYRALQFFLDSTHRGTSEQFATAFAVMARTLALPTRVAVGFKPGVEQDGTWHVHAGDVLAWPEVRFQGIGWVPFYPTPDQQGASAGRSKPPSGAPDDRQNLDRQTAEEASQPVAAGDPAPTAVPPRAASKARQRSMVPLFAGCCAGLVVGYLALVLAAPAVRRRRRRKRPDAAERVLGAWQQAVLHLHPLIGTHPAFASLTAHEIGALGARTLGSETAPGFTALAQIVDHTRFAGQSATTDMADEAWRLCRGVEQAATRAVPLWRRALRRLHPRMLWRG